MDQLGEQVEFGRNKLNPDVIIYNIDIISAMIDALKIIVTEAELILTNNRL